MIKCIIFCGNGVIQSPNKKYMMVSPRGMGMNAVSIVKLRQVRF
jgi:hypothetical protein